MRAWLCLFLILTIGCHRNKKPDEATKTKIDAVTNPGSTKVEGGVTSTNKNAPASKVNYFEDGANTKPTDITGDAFEIITKHYKKIGAPAPFYDNRLSSASVIFAENVPASGALNRKFIDFYLSQQGIAEPYPKVVAFTFDPKANKEFLEKLAEAMSRIVPAAEGADLRIGMGMVTRDGATRLILTMLPGRLLMGSVPRQVKTGATINVKGSLNQGYKSPRLVITSPDGNTQSYRNEGKSPEFSFEAKLANAGRYEIEVVAEGKTGPEVCGLFSVYAGVDLPEPPLMNNLASSTPVPIDDAEKLIFELVNKERKKAGLSALLPLVDAQKVARLYSQEMVTTGKVGHISAISGKPEDRLKKGGVKSPLILENVARSYSPEDAHSGLMDSPGHRSNVLNPKVTHMGVGVAVEISPNSPPAYYVTECFVKVGMGDPKKLSADLPEVLKNIRSDAGVKPLDEDAKLSEVAARFLPKLASGEVTSNNTAQLILDEANKGLNVSYDTIAPFITPLVDLDVLAQAKALSDKQFTHYGAALTVAGKPGNEQIILILILAKKR